jgi:exonuclease III
MGKRNLMFTELSKYSNDIIMLQETHSTALDERHYKNKWGPNVFFSHGQSNSKGVITIVPKNFNGSSSLIYADLEGRILIIKITINDEEFIICNIYAQLVDMKLNKLKC